MADRLLLWYNNIKTFAVKLIAEKEVLTVVPYKNDKFSLGNADGLIKLLSKLSVYALNNDDSFLSELLNLAMEYVPEADYGSVSVVEHGLWRFVDAKGHNGDMLKKLSLKADYKTISSSDDKLSNMDYSITLVDNIVEKSKEHMPDDVYDQMSLASAPIKQSLLIDLNSKGESLVRIALDIDKDSSKAFTAEAKKTLGVFGSILSIYMAIKQSNPLVNKLEGLVKLSGKMSSYAMEGSDGFLVELLDMAIRLIPEADYGSISIIEEDNWNFVVAVGHDIDKLKYIPFKKDYFYDFNNDDIKPFVLYKEDNVVLTDYIVDNVQPKMPEEIHRVFAQASKPIRQSLIVQLNINNEWLGHLGLDIDINSQKKFSVQSVKVLNAFGSLASAFMAFQRLSALQKLHQQEMNLKLQKSQEWTKVLEETITDRTFAVRNLLDNTGQGLLTFGENLTIDDEHSSQCSIIFGQSIKGKRLSELIHPCDAEQQLFFDGVFKEIFSITNKWSETIFLSLLPEEVKINSRDIKLEYKLINDTRIRLSKLLMVILTDVTEKRLLEDQVEQERRRLKMVVKIVANYGSFMECIRDYRRFCEKELDKILESELPIRSLIFEIFRSIHNFKGTLSLFDMIYVVSKLHELESKLVDIMKQPEVINYNEFKSFIKANHLIEWLKEDLDIIGGMLGDSFLNNDNIMIIDKTCFKAVEKKIINELPAADCRQILPDLRRLSFRPFRELLRTYPEYVQKLSDKFGKLLGRFDIDGGDMLVDMEKYHVFARALVHIFRNAIDHGIEGIEERCKAGKLEYGSIKCSIESFKNEIEIIISDDGRGIDPKLVAQRAIEGGVCSKEELAGLSKGEILNLVFVEGFSTRTDVTELSGRGVGLAAVKNEVDKLGGTINIHTTKGMGTTFCIRLPLDDAKGVSAIAVSDVMNPIIETTKQFINGEMGLVECDFGNIYIEQVRTLPLKRVAAFINVKGILSGKFIMSMDEGLIRCIIRRFVLEELTPEDEAVYMEDTLAECANIILGNSIKLFPNIEEYVTMESPVTMLCDKASIKYAESGIWTSNVECELGSLSISFVSDEFVS